MGSQYYIASVDGSWAWLRVSDHWGPPRRFALDGGLSQGKYPVTQAGYIRIGQDGQLDISSDGTVDPLSEVARGYGQVKGGPRRSRVRVWIRAVLDLPWRCLAEFMRRRRS